MTPRPDTEELEEAATVQIGGAEMQRMMEELDVSEEAATVIFSPETMQDLYEDAALMPDAVHGFDEANDVDEPSECIFDEDSLASAAAAEAAAAARAVVEESGPAPLRRMPSRADLVDRNRGAATDDSAPRSAPSRIPWLVAGAAAILAAATLVAATL